MRVAVCGESDTMPGHRGRPNAAGVRSRAPVLSQNDSKATCARSQDAARALAWASVRKCLLTERGDRARQSKRSSAAEE